VEYLAGCDQVLQRARLRPQRYVRVHAVLIEQVDVVVRDASGIRPPSIDMLRAAVEPLFSVRLKPNFVAIFTSSRCLSSARRRSFCAHVRAIHLGLVEERLHHCCVLRGLTGLILLVQKE